MFLISRLLLEEDPWKEPGLSGVSRGYYLTQVVLLEKLLQGHLAGPLRFMLNKLMKLTIYLALDWSDHKRVKAQRQQTFRDRLVEFLSFPVRVSITSVKIVFRKAKNLLRWTFY
jgi:hypothetical protein